MRGLSWTIGFSLSARVLHWLLTARAKLENGLGPGMRTMRISTIPQSDQGAKAQREHQSKDSYT